MAQSVDDLNKEFLLLKSIFESPAKYLSNHFKRLRNQVDDAFVHKMLSEQDDVIKKETNKNWGDMVEVINSFEKECLNNLKINFKQNERTFNSELQIIQIKINSLPLKVNDEQTKEIKHLIDNEIFSLQNMLFMSKTMVFLDRNKCEENSIISYTNFDYSKTTIGKLVIIKNYYFAKTTIEQLRNNKINFNQNFTNDLIKLFSLNKNKFSTNQIDIIEITFDAKELNLSYNKAVSIDSDAFKDFNNLVLIELDKNYLTRINPITFNSLYRLQHLNLSHNCLLIIEPGTFSGLVSLNELNLSCNQLKVIDSSAFNGLSNLRKLYLSSNQLDHIDSLTFSQLNNLKELYIDNNRISSIHKKLFNGLNNLYKLWIHNNNIISIDLLDVFKELNLGILKLENDKEIIFENRPKFSSNRFIYRKKKFCMVQ